MNNLYRIILSVELFHLILFMKPCRILRPVYQAFNWWKIVCQYNQSRYTKYPSLEYGDKPSNKANDDQNYTQRYFKSMIQHRQIKSYTLDTRSYFFLNSNSFDIWRGDEPQQVPIIEGPRAITFSIVERNLSISS